MTLFKKSIVSRVVVDWFKLPNLDYGVIYNLITMSGDKIIDGSGRNVIVTRNT